MDSNILDLINSINPNQDFQKHLADMKKDVTSIMGAEIGESMSSMYKDIYNEGYKAALLEIIKGCVVALEGIE
jgi:uncharacterized protein YihD (DUF1040 family)